MTTDQHDIERWSGLFATVYSVFGRNPQSNRKLVELAGVGPGDRVLDIGSGPGAALEYAHAVGAEVYGVDPTPSMVKRAARRVPDATVVEGHAESLPFPADHFTHVWTISTFHHWASPEAGLEESHRVLAPDGRLLIVERKLKTGKSGHGLDSDGAEEVAEQLVEHGFHDCTVDTMRAKRAEYLVVGGST